MTATSYFVGKTVNYWANNAHYDRFLRKQLNQKSMPKMSYVDMTDTVRKWLLESLGYDPGERGGKIGS